MLQLDSSPPGEVRSLSEVEVSRPLQDGEDLLSRRGEALQLGSQRGEVQLRLEEGRLPGELLRGEEHLEPSLHRETPW